ncbi:uncharacterized protein LOC130647974 isoform X3 [Hydractinia symbiolongicarpus]|uniref:uncharacterized protein LOC130647974 isoform X3 n=1 Tax=Hydractinia symbiolongicarpus TaxID=13093 RepID=UPI00254A572E|nr:uncharacterized protein LOC130647974 isoform X3 [Hydractinia symbiolongicarpus]
MVAMDSNQEVQKTFESDFKSLSHKEALTVSRNLLEELLKDPLLQDIPKDTTASELQAKLDLEKGRAFIVNLRRSSEEGFEHIRSMQHGNHPTLRSGPKLECMYCFEADTQNTIRDVISDLQGQTHVTTL